LEYNEHVCNRSLFEPFSLKSLNLKNRFVMAPMTRGFSPDGVPTAAVAAYYRRRAEGEVGLIISEGTLIDRHVAGNNPNYPHFHGGNSLRGWKAVIDQVHQAGGKMGPQLWHLGIVPPGNSGIASDRFEGPSGLLNTGEPSGHAMTEEDIADTVDAYAKSAANAEHLGFDMLEIHGAHGYLVDQFFWDFTNRREDRYGGPTITDRARFGAEVVKAIRAAVGSDFVISLRISQWKSSQYGAKVAKTPQELEEWLNPLTQAGVDLFHCSQRRFWEPEFEGSDMNLAGWTKKVTGVPTITVGSVGLSVEFTAAFRGEGAQPVSLDELKRRFDRGDFDLVAIGRVLLSDPAWVRKLREGREGEFVGFDKSALATLV
jgi:2,4-dienoyl-CoA reductase-like NADH-dependent reductase (Old Yellow Enzyme family)